MENQAKTLQVAVTTILRALKIAETRIQVAHREFNFVPADIQTMRFLTSNPGCNLTDVASHLDVVPTTASSIIDRLVERGFVKRERTEANRRVIRLQLTDTGTTVFGRLEAEELVTMQIILDALPVADRKKFIANMTTIAKHVS